MVLLGVLRRERVINKLRLVVLHTEALRKQSLSFLIFTIYGF
jgi:hypothetical protein